MVLTKPPRPTLRPPMTLGELHQELLSICSQMRCGAAELEDSLCRTLSTGILRLPFRTQSLQKTRTSLVDGRSQRFVFPSCPRTPSLLTLAPSEFASRVKVVWSREEITSGALRRRYQSVVLETADTMRTLVLSIHRDMLGMIEGLGQSAETNAHALR